MANKIFDDLLERAKEVRTLKQSMKIDNETWSLYDKGKITSKQMSKVVNVLDAKSKEVGKKLNSGDIDSVTKFFEGD